MVSGFSHLKFRTANAGANNPCWRVSNVSKFALWRMKVKVPGFDYPEFRPGDYAAGAPNCK